ncbi:hypothetical protein GN244_ATG07442 [Phytophthora infestans]|uniref:Uncharacterized protein n=1 Tax=Phytophthora infestans TaxID=4787 RepID=A0A833TAX1_PHYIN|nr:hypothetical protein GN244_ATG07442 [Phytophthora infestans]KAI9980660.1 hypothetical protein PInf_009963 [Phytophthora infestans]
MNAAFKPHPNLRQFASAIGRMSSVYVKKQVSITRGLRRKKQRLQIIALPRVPGLTEFEVPPASDSSNAGFEESDVSLESLCGEIDDNLGLSGFTSSDEEPMGDATAEELTDAVVTPKDSEQRIIEAANVYDNSLAWDGDQEADKESSSADD